jgi:uncharacterized protein (DUF2344 family)
MLNVKFTKTGSAAYMSHLDLIKTINRIIKRAGYEPHFSKGFNPHSLLKLGNAMPLGLKSEAEYFTLEIDDLNEKDFIKNCNAQAPSGIKFLKAWKTDKNPAFARDICAVLYEVDSGQLTVISCLKEPVSINIKPDLLLEQINNEHGLSLTKASIVKVKAYMKNEKDELVDVDDVLELKTVNCQLY